MARKPAIGLIAPSGQVTDQEALERGIAYFRARGWRVVAPGVKRVHQRFAGDDEARLAALYGMAAQSEVKLVMAVRGSYGLSRLLGRIDYKRLAAAGQRYVGHSDFTALLCANLARAGLHGFSGPMACYDFGAAHMSAFTEAHFWRMLDEGRDEIEVKGGSESALRVQGPLWGGNLAMIASLVGTPYLPKVRGGLLYVEDISEHPYRIERMLLQLHQAGLLKTQRALLLGDFSGYKLAPHDNGYDFATMVAHLRETLDIPVVTGLPFGHTRDKLTLPMGGKAVLSAEKGGWHLAYGAEP
ncbi:MAG: ldcA [Betaproteobacteria bacterium]|nr:ldcA [Betaproteobacteria bacterium]